MPPEPQLKGRSLTLKFAVVALLLVVSILVFWYYQKNMSSVNPLVYKTHFDSAMSSYRSGDYNSAINTFGIAVGNATSKGAETQAREMVALNMFFRNQGDDRAQAIAAYKQIIEDTTLPAAPRALALADLAILVGDQGDAFAKQYFSQPPFDYYVSSGSRYDIFHTTTNMFKASDELSLNSLAEYGIAFNYSVLILNESTGKMTAKDAATLIWQYIQKGDQNIATIQQLMPSNSARAYSNRAMALSVSGRVLDNVSLEEREQAFKIALSKGGVNEQTDPQLRDVMMRLRLNYAIFLMRSPFQSNRDADIKVVLQPFALAVSNPEAYMATRASALALSKVTDASFMKSRMLALGKISPDLKAFLLSVGWKL